MINQSSPAQSFQLPCENKSKDSSLFGDRPSDILELPSRCQVMPHVAAPPNKHTMTLQGHDVEYALECDSIYVFLMFFEQSAIVGCWRSGRPGWSGRQYHRMGSFGPPLPFPPHFGRVYGVRGPPKPQRIYDLRPPQKTSKHIAHVLVRPRRHRRCRHTDALGD